MSSISVPSMFHQELQTYEIRVGVGLPTAHQKTSKTSSAAAQSRFPTDIVANEDAAMTDVVATTEDANQLGFETLFISLFVFVVLGIMAVLLFQMSLGISDALRTTELSDFLRAFRGPA